MLVLIASITAWTDVTTISLPDFLDEIILPSLSSTLTETSAEAAEPPVIESNLYSLILILAISFAMV